jgi:type 1 glutamine amidotransferase
MNLPITRRTAIAATVVLAGTLGYAAEPATQVLVLVGPSNHPPGTHEVKAGGQLLGHCLEAVNIKAEVRSDWPTSGTENYAAVVFIGDLFPPEVLPQRDAIMRDLAAMTKRGCGIVAIHYATGLEAKHVAEDGEHPLLHWTGGYFATRCKHHQSVARVFKEATIEPAAKDSTDEVHPLARGWKTFTIHDEPYIKNYFGKDGPAKNVCVIATANLPPEKPQPEPVAWAIERDDGGRGAAVVMPHFYRNWKNDDLRTLILNCIVWAAKKNVPIDGVRVELPELAMFKPVAVEPPVKK